MSLINTSFVLELGAFEAGIVLEKNGGECKGVRKNVLLGGIFL